jgi:predicted CXXCH cytochrome family protein
MNSAAFSKAGLHFREATLARDKHKSGKKDQFKKRPVVVAPTDTPPAASASTAWWKSKTWIRVLAAMAVIGTGGLAFLFFNSGYNVPFAGPHPDVVAPATFVGSEACAGCHHAEADLWNTSQHKHAMQHATAASVLGNFDDASFDHYGVHSRFFKKDGKFVVETDGPDGNLALFEVKYTFGVDPLQQYLIEFPDGRLQALSIAWDSRLKEQGGQRWFHLYPNEEIKHDDILHWTRLNQNWNFMCAECHSTGVQKNYDAANDRFATTWAEISVGCEACHGKGSRHVSWAHDQQRWSPFGKSDDPEKGLAVFLNERNGITWLPDPRTGNPQRSIPPAMLRKEVETCGLCHARRGEFSEDWMPGQSLSDTHVVSNLARGLYHADGQMLDEVYNYGSFKQSKMFAAGVTCSDCHDPHGTKLRLAVDETCLQCHSSDKYSSVTHHRHEAVTPPLSCASCHMPTKTYMVVDQRHDHSFRIPRPDLSAKLGTPNACNDCHADKSPQWAASAVDRWHGPNRKGFQNYTEAFAAAWGDQPDAAALLAAVAADSKAPAFARAGALTELSSRASPASVNLARTSLSDSDPMVRIAALDMLEAVPVVQAWPLASPLLTDSNRGVRIRAAALLAAIPTATLSPADRERFERAADEFIAAQRFNADRPEARSALGNFLRRRGQPANAETEYKAALQLSAKYVPAAINLADLFRELGRESESESVLRTALTNSPRDAGLHYSLGLSLVRLKRIDDAIEQLAMAADLEPDRARYAYVYAVALHSAGRVQGSIAILNQSRTRHPRDRDTSLALISFYRQAGNVASALAVAQQFALVAPEDQNVARLIEDLQQQDRKPSAP